MIFKFEKSQKFAYTAGVRTCSGAVTGSQARLRCVCRKTWEFKSPPEHKDIGNNGGYGVAVTVMLVMSQESVNCK